MTEEKRKAKSEKRKTGEQYYQAVGRRKRATATVRLFEGGSSLLVNDKSIEKYFSGGAAKMVYLEPFSVTKTEGKFSATVKVSGGGKSGQLGAVVLGFARALVVFDERYRRSLRGAGLLTRDSREKEPKKYWLRKARKRPQYSKR